MKKTYGGMPKSIKAYGTVLCGIAGFVYLFMGLIPEYAKTSVPGAAENDFDRFRMLVIAFGLFIASYMLYRSTKRGGVRRIIKTRYSSAISPNSRIGALLEENNMIIDNCMRQLDQNMRLDVYLRRVALLYDKVCECEAVAGSIPEYKELRRMVTDSFVKTLPSYVKKSVNEAKKAYTEQGKAMYIEKIRMTLEDCRISPDLYPAVKLELDRLPVISGKTYGSNAPWAGVKAENEHGFFIDKNNTNKLKDDSEGEKISEDISAAYGVKVETEDEDKLSEKVKDNMALEKDKAEASIKEDSAAIEENIRKKFSKKAEFQDENTYDIEKMYIEISKKMEEQFGEEKASKEDHADEAKVVVQACDEAESVEEADNAEEKPSIFDDYEFTPPETRFFKALISALDANGLQTSELRLHKMYDNTYKVEYAAKGVIGKIRIERDNNYVQYFDKAQESQELNNPSRKKYTAVIPRWIDYIKTDDDSETKQENKDDKREMSVSAT